MTYEAIAYCIPSLDSALLGLDLWLAMKSDFDWQNASFERSIFSTPHKRYYIALIDIEKITGSCVILHVYT